MTKRLLFFFLLLSSASYGQTRIKLTQMPRIGLDSVYVGGSDGTPTIKHKSYVGGGGGGGEGSTTNSLSVSAPVLMTGSGGFNGSVAKTIYLDSTYFRDRYVRFDGSYPNPSWITSFAYAKLTGAPAPWDSTYGYSKAGVNSLLAYKQDAATAVTLTGTQTVTNKTLTNPIISNILGANGTSVFQLVGVSSGVNYLKATNAASGSGPILAVDGAGTNVDLTIQAKGSGKVIYQSEVDYQAGASVDGAEITTNTDVQTLTNKTLTAPAISSPTGIVKGDVGLGNVDNTSDATKNSASATFTNKTISGASNTLSNIPQVSITNLPQNLARKKGERGDVYSLTLGASSGSSYTATAPNTTFAFTSGGLTLSGGAASATNFEAYTAYVTNVAYYTHKITFQPTSDGLGVGVGTHSQNGEMVGKFVMTGVDKGKVVIETYRSSVTTTRATSSAALSYTNSTDVIELTLTRSLMNWRITAKVVGSSANPVSVEWTDPLTAASIPSYLRAANPAIYAYGGTATVISDQYTIQETTGNELAVLGNSITAGAYAGSVDNMFYSILKKATPGGVSLIAGGSNRTSDQISLLPELLSLGPKIAIFCDGINDPNYGDLAATTQANILQWISTCQANNITPVLVEVTPISSSYTPVSGSNATMQAAITALNSWMNGLGFVKVVPMSAVFTSSGSLNAAYNSGDGIHLNEVGNRLYANQLMTALAGMITTNNSTGTATATTLTYSYNQNTASYLREENLSTGSSASTGFQAVGDNATGYLVTYGSTNNSGIGGASAGKTLVANNKNGLQVGAIATGAGVEFLAGSLGIVANLNGTTGRMFVGGTTAATAKLHLAAGSVTVSTAPLKFTQGPDLTVGEDGAINYNTSQNLSFWRGTVKHTIAATLTATATLDFASTAAQNSTDLTVTVTGAADGDAVSIGVPNGSTLTNSSYQAWVSAANTVTVRFNNYSSGSLDPASGTFRVSVLKY